MVVYNSMSFKLARDDTARAAIIQFMTVEGEDVIIGMSGEGMETLARTILAVLEQNPDMKEWRSVGRE
jgi:hypothetical protein